MWFWNEGGDFVKVFVCHVVQQIHIQSMNEGEEDAERQEEKEREEEEEKARRAKEDLNSLSDLDELLFCRSVNQVKVFTP